MTRLRTVDLQHAHREEPYHQHHSELAYRRKRAGHHIARKAYAHHEISHGGSGRKKDAAGHSLTIKHQEEGKINQSRTGFFLQNNEHHGEQHHKSSTGKVAHVAEGETILIDEFCHRQSCDTFGKFGRLQIDRTQADPRARTFDVFGYERRDDEHHNNQPIKQISQSIKIAIVEHQQEKAQAEAAAYPCELLSGACLPTQEIGVSDFVAGSTHTHPPETEQQDKDQDDNPVGGKQRIFARII